MSVRFDGHPDRLNRLDDLPTKAVGLTVAGFFSLESVVASGYGSFLSPTNQIADNTNGDHHLITTGSGTSDLLIYGGSPNPLTIRSSLTLGAWYFVAATMTSGTDGVRAYVAAMGENAFTKVVTTPAAAWEFKSIYVGTFNVSLTTSPHHVAGVRLWSGLLTEEELFAEMRQIAPVKKAGLHSFWPLLDPTNKLIDESGNAKHLAVPDVGPWELGSNPPVPWRYGRPRKALRAVDLTQTLTPTGIASTSAVGAPTVVLGDPIITPTGIASTLALGTATVSPGPVTVSTAGIASTSVFGTATVSPGPVTVSPTGIASTSAVGAPSVSYIVAPTGIASALAFGTATVTVTTPKLLFLNSDGDLEEFATSELPVRQYATLAFTTDANGNTTWPQTIVTALQKTPRAVRVARARVTTNDDYVFLSEPWPSWKLSGKDVVVLNLTGLDPSTPYEFTLEISA